MMRQPPLAPAALGTSVVVGIAAMLSGIYQVADCLRYQSRPGQCTDVIETQALPIVAGLAAIGGGWGGFNTINPELSRNGHPGRDPATGRFVKRKPEGEE
jgi:hypothetical protein